MLDLNLCLVRVLLLQPVVMCVNKQVSAKMRRLQCVFGVDIAS